MILSQAIDSYISLKRSLGAVYGAETRILRSFSRAMGPVPVDAIPAEACRLFCRGPGPPTRWWERKHYALRGFFAFLVSRGHRAGSPLPEPGPKIPPSFQPYIFSSQELQRLLDATAVLEDKRSLLQPFTFRSLLVTLYGAGLRPSEGRRLRCCDVDFAQALLLIWDTKFFQSRFVPIGADLSRTLQSYAATRRGLPLPDGPRSVFFASRTGRAIPLPTLENAFVRLRAHAGIERPGGARRQPRLHDLRHTFAVHRLVAWYREGVDVQACLPLLATYLGHVNLSGTQTYLTMTSELLAEASKRFEHYAAIGKEDNRHDR